MYMHNKACSHPGISPQALPQAGTHIAQDPHRYSSFDGLRVNFAQVDRSMHRVNRFPVDAREPSSHLTSYPGNYTAGMVCANGAVNVDNSCLCPGSADSMPFNLQPPNTTAAVTKNLFSPYGQIPQLTPSAQKLIKERSPLPNGAPYYQLDAPLPCNAPLGK